MDKPQEEQEVEKKISQYQNRQKILLNRKRSEEQRARTHRLIGRGAILEGVFPAVMEMEGEEVKAFLIALSRLPGRRSLRKRRRTPGTRGSPFGERRTYTPFRCRAPCRGLVASFGRDGGCRPQTPPHSDEGR